MECSFFIEIVAPDGLNGIDQKIDNSELGLYIYHSGFSNKDILKSKPDSSIELDMDISSSGILTGSGTIEYDFTLAKRLMENLSDILKGAGYFHSIGVDDENGENTFWIG